MTLNDACDVANAPMVAEACDGVWRPFQYLGTKTRALRQIGAAILAHSDEGDSVADPFTGSTVVAQLAANLGRRVVAADTSAGAVTAARALLGPRRGDVVDSSTRRSRSSQLQVYTWTVSRTSGSLGSHWKTRQSPPATGRAWWRCRNGCHNDGPPPGDEPEPFQSSLQRLIKRPAGATLPWASHHPPTPARTSGFARPSQSMPTVRLSETYNQKLEIDARSAEAAVCALLHAASRAAFSAGKHFAQPHRLDTNKDLTFHRARILQDRSISVPNVFREGARQIGCSTTRQQLVNEVLRADVLSLNPDDYVSRGVRVAYLDPPYTAQQYSRFYHVLDVLALGISPALQKVRGKTTSGLYPEQRYKSPFCSSRHAPAPWHASCPLAGRPA